MKQNVIVNGKKAAEVGNPMDFVVIHSNKKDRHQEEPKQYTEEDRQRYINKMLEETKPKKEQTKPKNQIRAFDRLVRDIADY